MSSEFRLPRVLVLIAILASIYIPNAHSQSIEVHSKNNHQIIYKVCYQRDLCENVVVNQGVSYAVNPNAVDRDFGQQVNQRVYQTFVLQSMLNEMRSMNAKHDGLIKAQQRELELLRAELKSLYDDKLSKLEAELLLAVSKTGQQVNLNTQQIEALSRAVSSKIDGSD